MPLSFAINVFPWMKPDGTPMFGCDDISIHFDLVGQYIETMDIVKQRLELLCNPREENEEYSEALFFRMNPTS